MGKVNSRSYVAVEKFLKEVKSFRIKKTTKTAKVVLVERKNIIFFDKERNNIPYTSSMNKILEIWMLFMTVINGEYGVQFAPICEDIMENELNNAQVKKFASYEEAEDFLEACEKKLMTKGLNIQKLDNERIMLNISRRRGFDGKKLIFKN